MTGWAFVAVVVLAAVTGSSVALLTDWARTEIRRYDAGVDDLCAQIDAERAQRDQR